MDNDDDEYNTTTTTTTTSLDQQQQQQQQQQQAFDAIDKFHQRQQNVGFNNAGGKEGLGTTITINNTTAATTPSASTSNDASHNNNNKNQPFLEGSTASSSSFIELLPSLTAAAPAPAPATPLLPPPLPPPPNIPLEPRIIIEDYGIVAGDSSDSSILAAITADPSAALGPPVMSQPEAATPVMSPSNTTVTTKTTVPDTTTGIEEPYGEMIVRKNKQNRNKRKKSLFKRINDAFLSSNSD